LQSLHHFSSSRLRSRPGASMPALAASGQDCAVSTIFEWATTAGN
jgi:hypothetical protein